MVLLSGFLCNSLAASTFVDFNTTRGLDNAIFFSAVPPRTRSVTALFPHVKYADGLKGLSIDFCYEQNEDLVPVLKEVINKDVIRGLINKSIPTLKAIKNQVVDPRVYDLMSPFTAQERKLVMQLSCGWSVGDFVWNIKAPFIFIERNVWLEMENQADMAESMIATFGNMGKFGPNPFEKEGAHFAYIAGLGNTVGSLGMRFPIGEGCEGIAGLRLIAPTSGVATRELLKADLDEVLFGKYLKDFQPLFDEHPQYKTLIDVARVLPRIRQIALNPLDTVPAAWATGVFLEAKVPFFEGKVDLWTKIECDYYYPYMVDRLVLLRQPISSDAPGIFDIGTVPTTLPLQLPFEVQARSKLGITGHAAQGVNVYVGEKSCFSFGYDLFHQARETLEVSVSDDIKKLMNTLVDIDGAGTMVPIALGVASELSQKRQLTQHRIFSSLKVEGFFNKTTALIIGGDYALSSGKMGPSWAVYTRVRIDF